MKKFIIICIILFTSVSFSQNINSDENGYYEIIKADSLSKEQIYNKAKEWVVLNYKSANDVIQLDSKNKIIVKGILKVPYLQYEHIYNHTLILSFKENRFKVELILNSMHVNLSNSIIVEVFKGYLSTDKEKIFERIQSDPRLTEDYSKKEFIKMFKNDLGFSEKRALKEWEKSKKDIMSHIPKTIDDIEMEPILDNVRKIKERVSSIINSIDAYVNKSNSDDKW